MQNRVVILKISGFYFLMFVASEDNISRIVDANGQLVLPQIP
jgi:hypothetical protein